MSDKRVIWTVIFGASALTAWRFMREGSDPIPQLAGITGAGIMLLVTAEVAPKLASSLSVLLGISLALNWKTLPTTKAQPLGKGGPFTGTAETPTGSAGGGGGAW